MTRGKIRLQLQRMADCGRGLRDVLPIPIETGQRKVAVPGFVVELKSIEQSFFGFVITILPPVDFTQKERCRSARRLQIHGALKSSFRLFPFPCGDESRAEQKMRFIKIGIKHQSFLQMPNCLRITLSGERDTSTNKFVASCGGRAGIDHIEEGCRAGICGSQLKNQEGTKHYLQVGILLRRPIAGLVDYHSGVTALNVAKAKAAIAVGINLIDEASAKSLEPDRDLSPRQSGCGEFYLNDDFKRIGGSS